MSNFPILDLVVGLIFVFFLLSIICSSAVELWFSIKNTRSKLLTQWLMRIFNMQALDSNGIPKLANGKPVTVGQEIMDHCMVTALSKTGKSGSFIDAENFVSALLDKITLQPAAPGQNKFQSPPIDIDEHITAIQNSNVISGELKRTILGFAYQAKAAAEALAKLPQGTNITTEIKSALDDFKDRLESWFNTNADRLTGTFKRKKVLPSTLIIATVVTIALNADSILISKYLYTNKEAAAQLADIALKNYQKIDSQYKANLSEAGAREGIAKLEKQREDLKTYVDSVRSLSLPLGWQNAGVNDAKSFWNYLFQWPHLAGLIATILAILMGAPFWFDLLNKLANLRGTGPKPVVDDNKKN